MPGQVHLRRAHPERPGHVFDWPFLEHLAIEDLELAGIDLVADLIDGRIEEVLLPLLVPNGVDVGFDRSGNSLHRGGFGRRRSAALGQEGFTALFALMVRDTAAGDDQEPVFERANLRIVFEAVHLPGDCDDCVLHDVLRFGIV